MLEVGTKTGSKDCNNIFGTIPFGQLLLVLLSLLLLLLLQPLPTNVRMDAITRRVCAYELHEIRANCKLCSFLFFFLHGRLWIMEEW